MSGAKAALAPTVSVPWRSAAAAGAAVVFGASAGDGFVAAVLLGVAAGAWAGGAAGLAVAATVARWGTPDLGLVAGNQDVLGAAVTSGPDRAAVSSGLAAAAVLLAVVAADGSADRRLVALAAGLGAGVLAAGPAVTGAGDAMVRGGAAVAGVAAAAFLSWSPVRRRVPRWAGVALGAVAVAAAVA